MLLYNNILAFISSGVVIANTLLLNTNSSLMPLPRSMTCCFIFIVRESVVIAEVNADEDRVLGDRFGIQGFPTLKFFAAGSTEPEDYEGGRTAVDLVRFVNEKIGMFSSPEWPTGTKAFVKTPVSNVKVLTPENFDEIVKNSGKTVFVKFYAPVGNLGCVHV